MSRGFTLVEVLFALTLSFLLASGAWALIVVHSRASLDAAVTADRLDAVRIVRGVVAAEIGGGRVGRDWSTFEGDSLVLRAFRGVAHPCGPAAGGVARVVVRGERRPDPAKDSVLILGPDGRWEALDLEDAVSRDSGRLGGTIGGGGGTTTEGCALPGSVGRVEEWIVPGLEGEFLLARIFERGSYHLADEAFRYRSGAGGRQPLTQALFDPDGWSLETPTSDPAALRLRLGFRDVGEDPTSTSREVTFRPLHP